jgi:CBS domain containing-hemolysin-like protein
MTNDLLKLAAVAFLILLNGFFVASEFSLVSARSTKADWLADEGRWSARAVRQAMAQPNRFISACQVGITVSSLTLGWLAQPAIAQLIEPSLERVLGDDAWIGAHIVAAAIAILLITTLHIVIGEQVPKMIAIQRPERAILSTAPIIGWITLPIRPFIAFLYWLTDTILDAIGLIRQAEHSLVYTEDELKLMVSASRMHGYLEPSEQEMIERVFAFADVETDEIMVPRTEMLALSATATLDDVADLVDTTGHTRFPVYGDDLDDLIGVFHAKDLIRQQFKTGLNDFNIRRFVHPAVFVSAHTPLDELLATMKAKRTHMAIVVDEYGGVSGLVTIEDVLEQIVGDIGDEYDVDEDLDIRKEGERQFTVRAQTPIEDFNHFFDTRFSDEEFDTIGGLAMSVLGRLPRRGESFRLGEMDFKVLRADRRRLDTLRVVTLRDIVPKEE